MKGLVLGPIHKNRKDDLTGTDLQLIDPTLGSWEDFDSLLQAAKKKSGCLCFPRQGQVRKGLAFGQSKSGVEFLSGVLLMGSGFSWAGIC